MATLKDLTSLFSRANVQAMGQNLKGAGQNIGNAYRQWQAKPSNTFFKNPQQGLQNIQQSANRIMGGSIAEFGNIASQGTNNRVAKNIIEAGTRIPGAISRGYAFNTINPLQNTKATTGGGKVAEFVGSMYGYGQSPITKGIIRVTNPLANTAVGSLSPQLAKILGNYAPRISGAVANVGQGLVFDAANRQPTTPLSVGLDVVTGLIGGPNQFKPIGKGFTMGNRTMTELAKAEDMMKYPDRYLGTFKTGARTEKEALKIIRDEGIKTIEQLSARYLPNDQLGKTRNIEQQIKALVNLNQKNQLGYFPEMGLVDKKNAQAPVRDIKPTVKIKPSEKVTVPQSSPIAPTIKVSPQKTVESPTLKVAKNESVLFGKTQSTSIPEIKTTTSQTQLPPSKASDPVASLVHTIAQNGSKERKFVTTVKSSSKTVEPVREKVSGQYIPKSNDTLSRAARSQIKSNIDVAREKALNGADDESVAIANELIAYYSSKKDYDSAAYIANTAAENLTSLGRAVQAASLYDKLTPQGIQRYAASQLQKVKMKLNPEDAKRLFDQAQRVSDMPAGEAKAMAQQQLMREVQDLIPTPVVQKIITLWKAGLLTGLKTTGRNITSNAINQVAEIVKDVPATMTDILASMFTGKRSKTLTIKGTASGFGEGVQKGVRLLKTGFDERKQMGKLDTNYVNWGKSKLGQVAKAYTETVFRFLGAQDQPFYYASLKRSLYDQAQTAAINAGKSGDKAFIENLVSNPTEQMIKTSVSDAEKAVFQNKTAIGSAINQAKAKFKKESSLAGAAADFIIPFTGVPSSVAGQVINYSPVGLAKTIIQNIGAGKFNQREFAEGIGRGLTGTAVMAIGVKLMEKGLMTLNSPKSEKERQQWELEGKKPFSVLVDGKWRSIGSLGPQASVLLQGGYLQKGGPGEAILGGLKQQKEQTFLKGISSLTDAIDNPQGYAKGYAQSVARGMVPTIIGDVAQGIDPLQRETNTVLDTLKSRIPGQRDSLLPKRNAFGEAMPNEQGFIGTMIDIFNSSSAKSTPIINELRRLMDAGESVTPTKIDKTQSISGVKVNLTSELQDALESQVGPIIKKQWEQVIASPQYQALSDENKAKVLQGLLENIRGVEKLRVTSGVEPQATAKAITNLTKAQRQYLLTGNMDPNYPSAEKDNITNGMSPQQIQQVNSVLSGVNSPENLQTTMAGKDFSNNIIDKTTTTGTLAKLEISRHNSEITAKINDIYDLYSLGAISAEDAEKQIVALQAQKISSKKPRKIKISMPKSGKVQTLKITPLKAPKLKSYKPKKLRIAKSKKPKLLKLIA